MSVMYYYAVTTPSHHITLLLLPQYTKYNPKLIPNVCILEGAESSKQVFGRPTQGWPIQCVKQH